MGLTKRLAPRAWSAWKVSSFIALWSDSTALPKPGLLYHPMALLKLLHLSFPCFLQSCHLVPQTMVKDKGTGVSTSAPSFPRLQIRWEASPEMQSKCHQKGKNNQVCGLPCPQLLSFSSFGDVRVGGDTDGEVWISQSVGATTTNT